MTEHATLASELEAIVGVDDLEMGEGLAEFSVDGTRPKAVVRPSNTDEVARVLRHANDHDMAVIPWGGGSEIRIGNPPERYEIALSTSRLSELIEYEPADLTATCRGGMTLGALQDALAKEGQTVPFDPRLSRNATVGGLLATNASGAARHTYGTPRDFTIGARVVTGDGLITKAGGKVVKNVAGYDMCKLYIGSRGTLGVITEATFKLMPLPAATDSVCFRSTSAHSAAVVAADVYRSGLSVRSAVLINAAAAETFSPKAAGYLLAMGFAGTEAGVQRSVKETRALGVASGLTEVAGDLTDPAFAAFVDRSADETVVRCSTLPSRVAGLTDAIANGAGGAKIAAAPVAGIIRAGWSGSTDGLTEILSSAKSIGASVIVENCPLGVKSEIDVFGEAPASLQLMRRMKQQFDPARVLSPGRFVARI